MKTQVLARGLRATFTATEIETLLDLAERGAAALAADRAASSRGQALAGVVVDDLARAVAELHSSRDRAGAQRAADRRQAQAVRDRKHFAQVDGFNVLADRGDWVDVSRDPDFRQWADLRNPMTIAPDQAEIRRDTWRVYVTQGSTTEDDFRVIGGCTETSDRAAIEPLVRRMIEAAGFIPYC